MIVPRMIQAVIRTDRDGNRSPSGPYVGLTLMNEQGLALYITLTVEDLRDWFPIILRETE